MVDRLRNLSTLAKTVTVVVTLIATVVGAVVSAKSHFATAEDLSAVKATHKELDDQIRYCQESIVKLDAAVNTVKATASEARQDIKELLKYMLENPPRRKR